MNPFIAVNTHLRKWFRSDELEIIFPLGTAGFEVEVTLIKPGKGRDYVTLITNGLSAARSMELCVLLPPTVKLDNCTLRNPDLAWAAKMLAMIVFSIKQVALDMGAAIYLSKMIDGTNFSGYVITAAEMLPKGFSPIQAFGKEISVNAVIPLYIDELSYFSELPLAKGEKKAGAWGFPPEKLNALVASGALSEIINRNRKTSCPGGKPEGRAETVSGLTPPEASLDEAAPGFFARLKKRRTPRERIRRHLRKWFREDEVKVISTLKEDDFSVEINLIQPGKGAVRHGKDRDYFTLLSNGLTAKWGMELCMLLPPTMNLEVNNSRQRVSEWPLKLFTFVVRMYTRERPRYGKVLEWRHRFGETKFTGAVIFHSISFSNKFQEMRHGWKRRYINAVLPLYGEEMRLVDELSQKRKPERGKKNGHWPRNILVLFGEKDFDDVVDKHRPSLCAKT